LLIEELKGISDDMKKRLVEAGYKYVESVATETPANLALVLETKVNVAGRIISICRQQFKPTLITGLEFKEHFESLPRIPTGSEALDELLNGGILMEALTEFAGGYGSGKTQTCFTLSVMVQQEPINGSVIFIDTERTFRGNRIEEIARARGIKENVLENIYVIPAETSDKLILTIDALRNVIREFNKTHERKIKLVIVDSLISPFRADFVGRSELPIRQQKLGHVLKELQRIAKEFSLAVVFTNQVVATPDAFGKIIPTGGHVLAHVAQYRLFFRKSKENKRIIRIIDAPDIPEQETVIRISEKGIE